jgi:hypothetical protein
MRRLSGEGASGEQTAVGEFLHGNQGSARAAEAAAAGSSQGMNGAHWAGGEPGIEPVQVEGECAAGADRRSVQVVRPQNERTRRLPEAAGAWRWHRIEETREGTDCAARTRLRTWTIGMTRKPLEREPEGAAKRVCRHFTEGHPRQRFKMKTKSPEPQ